MFQDSEQNRSMAVVPLDFQGDAVLWATWLYYAEGMTQEEVSRTIQVSRATAANYIAEGRRRGWVTVNLKPDLLSRLSIGRAVAKKYGLEACSVAPTVVGRDLASADSRNRNQSDVRVDLDSDIALRKRMGCAAAQAILPMVGDGTCLGVAWGRTVMELALCFPETRRSKATVIQVSGSSLGDSASSPEACAALMANRLGARSYSFHAPAVVTRVEVREALMAEPSIKRHFERIQTCNLVVFGVGELSPSTTWSDTDLIDAPTIDAYLKRGSAGGVMGRFIDKRGQELHGPLSGRQIGMDLEDLAKIPVRVCVAGGAAKQTALRATLAGGYITHLVTDELTARALLEGTYETGSCDWAR